MHFSQRLVEREAFSFHFPSQELMYKKKGCFFPTLNHKVEASSNRKQTSLLNETPYCNINLFAHTMWSREVREGFEFTNSYCS